MSSRANVHFFRGGNFYATRTWFFVPRVGDEVMLGPDEDRKAYKVIRVLWGNDGTDWRARGGPELTEPQRVNIEIEEIKP